MSRKGKPNQLSRIQNQQASKRPAKSPAIDPRDKVLIGIPQERQPMVDSACFFSFMALAQQGWQFAGTQYGRTDSQRNAMAVHLLESDAEWLLMLDADHAHPADIAQRLWRDATQHPEIKIIGGLAFRRGEPYEPMAYKLHVDGTQAPLIEPILYDKPGIYPVDRIATCSLMVHRSVFETTPFPWFRYDYTTQERCGWPDCGLDALKRARSRSEDLVFCDQAREAGHQVYVDTGIISPHAKLTYVGPDTFKRAFYANPATQTQMIVHKAVPGFLDPETPGGDLLYVGARPDSCAYVQQLYDAGHTLTLLEAWPSNAEHYRGDPRFGGRVIEGDVRTTELPEDSFDYVFWWHGPEHITDDELAPTLARLEHTARKAVILGLPWGEYPQGEYDGNPYEPHVNTIYPERLETLGYQTATAGGRDQTNGNITAWKAVT